MRLRDALADGFAGEVAREALWRTFSLAASVVWKFPSLLSLRRWWWVRLPGLCAVLAVSLAQQLPCSPAGNYAFDVRPGWREGTRVVYPARSVTGADGRVSQARPVAFVLRERAHRRISRRPPLSSGDLVWRGSLSWRQAARGTRVTVTDLNGTEHALELQLMPSERAGTKRVARRLVGEGLGLPCKSRDDRRGDLYVEIALSGCRTAR